MCSVEPFGYPFILFFHLKCDSPLSVSYCINTEASFKISSSLPPDRSPLPSTEFGFLNSISKVSPQQRREEEGERGEERAFPLAGPNYADLAELEACVRGYREIESSCSRCVRKSYRENFSALIRACGPSSCRREMRARHFWRIKLKVDKFAVRFLSKTRQKV